MGGGGEGGRWGRRGASLAFAALAFIGLSALAGLIFRGAGELARLESRNEAERILNGLLGGLRDHADFGAAVEALPTLREKVKGIGVFDRSGQSLYAWGEAPPSLPPPEPGRAGLVRFERSYIERGREKSLVLLLRSSRLWPPPPSAGLPPPLPRLPRAEEGEEGRSAFFETLRESETLYLALSQAPYFTGARARALLFGLAELLLALLVLGARSLLLRNLEYRERIEEQKQLVVLGTAASTLAHEIKNPLLAIRLQTSLLSRSLPPGTGAAELSVIEAEVERLSRLSHRVGDWLREPGGSPRRLDPAALAAEAGQGLLGREAILSRPSPPALVLADPERLRSLLENLLRNALESGGAEGEVGMALAREGGELRLEVLDRGRGLSREAAARAFDPFYTTKSRGSGIGLPIARRFAEAMGGRIELLPREGGGTAARLSLPLAPASEAPGPAEAGPGPDGGGEA